MSALGCVRQPVLAWCSGTPEFDPPRICVVAAVDVSAERAGSRSRARAQRLSGFVVVVARGSTARNRVQPHRHRVASEACSRYHRCGRCGLGRLEISVSKRAHPRISPMRFAQSFGSGGPQFRSRLASVPEAGNCRVLLVGRNWCCAPCWNTVPDPAPPASAESGPCLQSEE